MYEGPHHCCQKWNQHPIMVRGFFGVGFFNRTIVKLFSRPTQKSKGVRTKLFVDISERTEAYKHVRQRVHPSFRWWRLA